MSELAYIRCGTGYDVHAFSPNRPLVLGGVTVPYHQGLLGHSDADVLTHALIDALLSAARLPDIGELFPDTNKAYAGISSIELLSKAYALVQDAGYVLLDADCTVMAEAPKLAAYKFDMRQTLAQALGCDIDQIGIKSTTTEKLGFVGRKEGIAALAVSLLTKKNV